MRCPRCGVEYRPYVADLGVKRTPIEIKLYCDSCDTMIRVNVTQQMVNEVWHNMDMGGLNDAALSDATHDAAGV